MDVSKYKELLGSSKKSKSWVNINWKPKHKYVAKFMQKFKTKIKSRYLVRRLLKTN